MTETTGERNRESEQNKNWQMCKERSIHNFSFGNFTHMSQGMTFI